MGSFKGRIMANCKLCDSINNFNLQIISDPNERDKFGLSLSLCCDKWRKTIPLCASAEETLSRFIGMREMVLADSVSNGGIHIACQNCPQYQEKEWYPSAKISYISLGLYPSPCQARCCYCTIDKELKRWHATPEVEENYRRVFEVLNLAKERGVISSKALWGILSGEITIHPYKDRIYDLIRGQRACFMTNMFLYDPNIANNLRDNAMSSILFSIDAGTSATWKHIKGADNFPDVIDNLAQYAKEADHPDQIELKYIILPGINDSDDEFQALIEIMKRLNIHCLYISRDQKNSFPNESEPNDFAALRREDIVAASKLWKLARENELAPEVHFWFRPKEQAEIIRLGNEF